jgi:Virulence activator alpha C-term
VDDLAAGRPAVSQQPTSAGVPAWRAHPGEAREYLESLRSFADAEHARYEQIRDSYDGSDDDACFFARAALEHGLQFTRMQSEWATQVIDGLEKRLPAPKLPANSTGL